MEPRLTTVGQHGEEGGVGTDGCAVSVDSLLGYGRRAETSCVDGETDCGGTRCVVEGVRSA